MQSDDDSDSSFSAGESDEEFLILPKKKRKKRGRPAVKKRKKRHPPRKSSYIEADNEPLLFRYNSSHLNYSPSIPVVPRATILPATTFQPSPPLYIPHNNRHQPQQERPEIIEIDTDTFMDSPCDPEPQLLDQSSEILMEKDVPLAPSSNESSSEEHLLLNTHHKQNNKSSRKRVKNNGGVEKPRKRRRVDIPAVAPPQPGKKKLTREERKMQQYWKLFMQMEAEEAQKKLEKNNRTAPIDEDTRWNEHDKTIEDIPPAAHFTPTTEEFIRFDVFSEKINAALEEFGIVKVTAPKDFDFHYKFPYDKMPFPYSQQEITLRETHSKFENAPAVMISASKKKTMTIGKWKQKCTNKIKNLQERITNKDKIHDPDFMEKLYWRWSAFQGAKTMYGNDISNTCFGCDGIDHNDCSCRGWGMNCLPKLSLLKYINSNVPGVNSPMLYIASLWSTFTWHIEDSALQSINYEHEGCSRTWYGVPAYAKKDFENTMKERLFPNSHIECSAKMFVRKCTMFSPVLLRKCGVPVYKTTQNPRDFIITGAGAYHSGFSHGYAVCEAVNFALKNWISWGPKMDPFYRSLKRVAVVSLSEMCVTIGRQLVESKQRGWPELITGLSYVKEEEKKLRLKWLADGANFIQNVDIHTDGSKYCLVCHASLHASYMVHCRDEAHKYKYCLRHAKRQLRSEGDGPWVVYVGVTGGEYETLIQKLR